jgi:hypothetical protein
VPSTTSLGPDPEVIEFLRSLAPGSVVAQLDDGSLAVCADVTEAEGAFAEQARLSQVVLAQPVAPDRGWSRLAATLDG